MKSLKDIRKEQRITQRKLSELTGISQGHLSFIESGRFKPNQITRDKIENILGKIDWIESEPMSLQKANFYKAERLVKKLVSVSLTMCSCDRSELKHLINKYF